MQIKVLFGGLCAFLSLVKGFAVEDKELQIITTAANPSNLGPCEGDCDNDGNCQQGLYCFQRSQYQAVPGCSGGETDSSRTDYCVYSPLPELISHGRSPPTDVIPLGLFEGSLSPIPI